MQESLRRNLVVATLFQDKFLFTKPNQVKSNPFVDCPSPKAITLEEFSSNVNWDIDPLVTYSLANKE